MCVCYLRSKQLVSSGAPLDITAKYRSAMNVRLCCADQNRVPRPVQVAFGIFGNAYGQNGCS